MATLLISTLLTPLVLAKLIALVIVCCVVLDRTMRAGTE